MKLPLKEPLYARYLYLSPENILHIFMPIVSGTTIGLDNTCKAVYALQEFFDKGHNANEKTSLKTELLAYKEALITDISLLEALSLPSLQKKERLSQVDAYLKVLKLVETHPELNCLNSGFPSYPRPLEGMMQDRTTSNLYSMILRPKEQDGYLRTEGINPIFRVAHKSVSRNIEHTESQLQKALINAFIPLTFHDLKTNLIKQVVMQLKAPFNFSTLKILLHDVVHEELGVAIDFSKNAKGVPITQDYIDEVMLFDKETKPEQYIGALVGFCAPDLFTTTIVSPFKYLIGAEHWSIATQFLLGLTNIYAVAKGKTDKHPNWGEIFDNRPELSTELAQTLAQAHKDNACVEEACLLWLNKWSQDLGLNLLFTPEDSNTIKHDVAARYMQIKDAPHFDEFFILDSEKDGAFVMHQGSIGISFARFVSSPLLAVPHDVLNPLDKALQQALKLSATIPHNNTLVQNEVEITTSTLDKITLQVLYEQIVDRYKEDLTLKKQLLAQLKIECPNFKAQINTEKFLQHVAFGQQNEAEKLLQNEELAQELLTAKDTPFTDYSGRTFTCSAYEYAWWARDSHMRFMLERYMTDDTKKELLRRVQHLEEFIDTGTLFKKIRGLVYTQQGKKYCTAHFDLTPLKKAFMAYLNACEKIFNNDKEKSNSESKARFKKLGLPIILVLTDAEQAELEVTWREIGLAQREVPAHIAQEYCSSKRSFNQVTSDLSLLDASIPANLEREFKFSNLIRTIRKDWFPFEADREDNSSVIIRAQMPYGIEFFSGAKMEGNVGIDLKAIEAIDKVRIEDLKQSLEHLALPSNSQAPNLHSS
jgi:hypothetical protein